MKSFAICGIVSMLLLAYSATTLASECEDSMPKMICDHLERLENRMTSLATRSTSLISKAVENAAERNARLFQRAVHILRNVTSSGKQERNTTDLVQLLKDLKETFEKIKAAQKETAENAMEAVEAAAMKVAKIIQKIITDAATDDHTDIRKFRQRLQKALREAHENIKKATLEAIEKVMKSNHKARMHVVRMLKDLGLKLVTEIQPALDSLSLATNKQIADNTEHEIEADFDAAANEAFEVIVKSDSGVSKRGWSDFWAKVQAKFQQLGPMIMQKIKEAAQKIKPQIYEKLQDIGKIILNEAKRVIVEIAGEIVVIAKSK